MDRIVSFPHLGNYYIVFNYFLTKALKCKVIIPPGTTRKTIELGSKYSPDFVCVPFKYNLGNYIEALDMGANTLIQGGGGCRYGYYGELQEKILRDLGYDFEFYNLIYDNHISLKKGYKFCRKINKRCNIFSLIYYLINSLFMIIFIDKIERYIRLNMGFEETNGEFERLEKEYFDSFKNNGILKNIIMYYRYKKKFRNIKINKPNNPLKVRIVGELFSLIDSNTSFNVEKKLIKMGVEVYRDTDLTYLLITKRFILGNMIRKGKKYIKYHLGADGTASVVRSMDSLDMDGILHLKSFGCTPEISAMSILPKISNEYKIPILYFSFDAEDNEVGVDTRLEAFYDMIKGRKDN
ncbi:MAG: hypothetical protein ACI310_03345 [Bacilli bacterium]